MASWRVTWRTLLLRRRLPEACGNRTGTQRRSRAVCRSDFCSPTRRHSGGDALSICWGCRLSASTVLELFQPVAGSCALETALATRQPVRGCCWTCSRCSAAILRRYGQSLQVCRAASRSPPAKHRSSCSDRASCARAAGSCSVSRNIIRSTVGDRRHTWRRAGRARCTQRAHMACRGRAATVWDGWPCAHGVEPLPGSCGDRPPTSVACMDALVRMRCHAKCPMLACHGAVLSARPVWVVFQNSIAVGRRNLSAVSSQWLFLVVYSSIRQLVTAERPTGALGAIGRFATSTLLLAPPVRVG